jgi:hypothetical protein
MVFVMYGVEQFLVGLTIMAEPINLIQMARAILNMVSTLRILLIGGIFLLWLMIIAPR